MVKRTKTTKNTLNPLTNTKRLRRPTHRYCVRVVCSLELVRCTRVTILFHTYIIRLIIVHSSKLTYKHPFIHAYIFRYVYIHTYVCIINVQIHLCMYIYLYWQFNNATSKQTVVKSLPPALFMQLKYIHIILFESPFKIHQHIVSSLSSLPIQCILFCH